MESSVILLENSLAQYRALLEGLRDLASLLPDGSPSEVEVGTARLARLHAEALETDGRLNGLLKDEGCPSAARPLLDEKRALLGEAALRLEELTARAGAGLATVGEEITRLRGGRKALTGYREAEGKQSPKVFGSF